MRLPLFFLFFCYSFSEGARLGDCRRVRQSLRILESSEENFHSIPVSGTGLKICDSTLSCCSVSLEQKLWESTKNSYSSHLSSSIHSVKSLFSNTAYKFDDFFVDLLSTSKIKFHKLFQHLYGIIYERNSDVFIDFFRDLEAYYERGELDLEDSLNNFFRLLYQRMFKVFNSDYVFDELYYKCVTNTMKKFQPFGDVPKKLTEQLRRIFVATRALAQGLLEGKKVIIHILKIAPKNYCIAALLKMKTCSLCQGFKDAFPCQNYCLNVVKGCLAHHMELGESWDRFIMSLQNVSDRLIGPFDIEGIVEPIGMKISEAIMNFQNSGLEVSSKVFEECGNPTVQKRETHENSERKVSLFFQRSLFDDKEKRDSEKENEENEKAEDSKFKILIQEIKIAIGESKGIWSQLPVNLCQKYAGLSSEPCWNGETLGSYSQPLISNGLIPQSLNPEVPLDVSKPDIQMNEQIFAIKLISKQLENAAAALPVYWNLTTQSAEHKDIEEEDDSGSGDPCSNSDDEDCFETESGSGDFSSDEETEDNWPPWMTFKTSSKAPTHQNSNLSTSSTSSSSFVPHFPSSTLSPNKSRTIISSTIFPQDSFSGTESLVFSKLLLVSVSVLLYVRGNHE